MARERPSACRQDASTRCLPADVAADYDVAIILIHAFVLPSMASSLQSQVDLQVDIVNNSSTTVTSIEIHTETPIVHDNRAFLICYRAP